MAAKTALLSLLVFWASAFGIDGLAVLDTISDNNWVLLPVDGIRPNALSLTPVTAHTNITVDCDSLRIYYYGSDTHGRDYNNNLIFYFDLRTFRWRGMYMKDPPASWIKVESPVIGAGSFWPATNTGHPVPSHVFDACKYIPGRGCLLLLQSSAHNYRWSGAFHDGLAEVLGGTGEPAAWLWDCGALQWRMLKNAVAPNVFIWPMAVSPDGQEILATNAGNTYTFDWADSTWSGLTTTGQKHSTYHTAMEYDTYIDKFVECGASSFEYYTFDFASRVWQKVTDAGPSMNGASIGYDTLNKVLIAHCADNGNSTYSNPGGNAKTWVRASATGQWTMVKSTVGGDYLPAHYGFGFRGEYDLALNVFYFMDNNYDIWAYRYKKGSTGVLARRQMERERAVLTVAPNPFSSRAVITIGKEFRVASCELSIFNINGKQLETRNLKLETRNSFTWDLSGLPPGLYFLRASAAGKTWSAKMVLAR